MVEWSGDSARTEFRVGNGWYFKVRQSSTRVLVRMDPGPAQCCKAPGRLLEPPERGGSRQRGAGEVHSKEML